jgi:hypothetical protein
MAGVGGRGRRSNGDGGGGGATMGRHRPSYPSKRGRKLITTALRPLERDMLLLDDVASSQPQLLGTEVGLLLGTIAASGAGPVFFPGTSVTEVLAPARSGGV